MNDFTLSVIIPAYDEAKSIAALLDLVAAAAYRKQIVVVDDGSSDGTSAAVQERRRRGQGDVVLLRHERNLGKGAAIRTGLTAATGQIVLVQDADLEYDPCDYPLLVEPLLVGAADVVYGSRYLPRPGGTPWRMNRVGVSILNLAVRLLYGYRLTDEATCYKAMRTDLLRAMDLQCERFEFCPEVTAKACRMRLRILEVPVRYVPRGRSDGKKIRWRDGVAALRALWRWRKWEYHGCPPTAAPVGAANTGATALHPACVVAAEASDGDPANLTGAIE
ncbi:MAG TPA: glycosyltransferase family 2 protein [Pirellulales bacterium]|nr:glycosyltransferase family 2 protein [Pirellulales bacterium]